MMRLRAREGGLRTAPLSQLVIPCQRIPAPQRHARCPRFHSQLLSHTLWSCALSVRSKNKQGVACSAVATQVASPVELSQLDQFLGREGDAGEQEALDIVQKLQEAGKLKAYGTARQVPKRLYSLEELRLNKIDAEKLLAPSDDKLARIRNYAQVALLAGFLAPVVAFQMEVNSSILLLLVVVTLAITDQVANGGGIEALALDAIARVVDREYAPRVAAHEAAHFLLAYLLGVLPRRYTLSSLDAWRRYGAFNVQAGTQFCDSAFQREVGSGKLSSSSLDRYCCVALAGVAEEYVKYGRAEGGLNDVRQLDSLLRALKFTQAKADGQIRWAVLNITSILRRHKDVHGKLAAAMAASRPVSECIGVIESTLAGNTDI